MFIITCCDSNSDSVQHESINIIITYASLRLELELELEFELSRTGEHQHYPSPICQTHQKETKQTNPLLDSIKKKYKKVRI